MKKITILLLVAALMFTLIACKNKQPAAQNPTAAPTAQPTTQPTAQPTAQPTTEPIPQDTAKPTSEPQAAVSSAVELLTAVWTSYDENDKFAAIGGSSENMVNNAPGSYSLDDAQMLDNGLGVPADNAVMIDDAASLTHMMNANTFTAGAFHLADKTNVQALADAIHDNLMVRQWLCGFPETLIIVKVEDAYVVAAFGNAELIDIFLAKLQTAFEGSEILYKENLAF